MVLRAAHVGLQGVGLTIVGEVIVAATHGLPASLMKGDALQWKAVALAGCVGLITAVADLAVIKFAQRGKKRMRGAATEIRPAARRPRLTASAQPIAGRETAPVASASGTARPSNEFENHRSAA